MSTRAKKCPDCFKDLNEGFKGLLWCLCGFKLYPEGYEKEGPNHSLLSQVFASERKEGSA